MADEQLTRVVAAADASFLIGVSFIEQIPLLEAMFERVYVAPAVWDEVVVRGHGRPGAAQVANATFIVRQEVQNQPATAMLQLFLGPGEAETLVLADEQACPLVLMDDPRGRRAAQQAGVSTLGVVGLLLVAKQRGLITLVRPLLDSLTAHGFRLSQRLIAEAVRKAGEG